jgi:hypothetical protein
VPVWVAVQGVEVLPGDSGAVRIVQGWNAVLPMFFYWDYNEQRHRGIALMTPAAARHSNFEMVIQLRQKLLKEAFRMRLERSFGRIRTCLRCGQPLGLIIRRGTQKTLLSHYPSGKPRLSGYPSMSLRQIVDPGSSWRPVLITVPLKR